LLPIFSTAEAIAMAIAKRFPELAPRLPRFRKPWMSEDYRMSIFDAVGLGLAFFTLRLKQKAGYLTASQESLGASGWRHAG